ncbi:MAG: universal stress protein [Caldimicrobium sp.]|nr:universal stress protein [Caldimicrobium sp.]MCX7613987.1 universal stress protein [Caldimicrobium sp.]MDW8182306.1 universal stress protein [Caldimicrobium sp.]
MTMELKVCNVLLATDGSEYSKGAERVAMKLADLCGAKIFVTRVVLYDREYMATATDLLEREEQKAKAIADAVKKEAIDKNIEAETVIVTAEKIEDGITEAAKEVNADLIVMGRRGVRGLAKFFIGSATLNVIPMAPCPVLIVPRAADVTGKALLGATDGSEVSLRAIDMLSKMAKKTNTKAYILAVARDEAETEKAQEALKKAEEIAKAHGINYETILKVGLPDKIILEVAKEKEADLIVMGNRGLKGISKAFLGSVSEKVVSNSDRGVLIVK